MRIGTIANVAISIALGFAQRADAQTTPVLADQPPLIESLAGFPSYDADPEGAHHDEGVQGSFSLDSTIALHSERMPILVDVFPKYSPRNGGSAWGQGWRADALVIRRTHQGRTPRFDGGDTLSSRWGELQVVASALYPRGLLSRVRGKIVGDRIEIHEASGVVWTYDGAGFKSARGVERWLLKSVADPFGNTVNLLKYTPEGNLAEAEWKRGGLLQHKVAIAYMSVSSSHSGEIVAGALLPATERVRVVSMFTTNRNDGRLVLTATYTLTFDAARDQPVMDWHLDTVTEDRNGITRSVRYTYGRPWAYSTNQKLALRPLAIGATLPMYPPARSFQSYLPGDVNGDGRTDFLAPNQHWWINQGNSSYRPMPFRRPDPSPECTDATASAPQIVGRPSSTGYPFAFRSAAIAEADPMRPPKRFAFSQCTLDGKLLRKQVLSPPPRPPASEGCPVPLDSKGIEMSVSSIRDGKVPFAIADLDADGVVDLAVMDTCRMLVWYGRWNGDELELGAVDSVPLNALDPAYATVVVDLNGDGLLDVLDYALPQHAWLNLGLQRKLPANPAGVARPLFGQRFEATTLTLAEFAKTIPDRGPGLARILTRLDNDPFVDLIQVNGPGSVRNDQPSKFKFTLYRGSPTGFKPIREIVDDYWWWGWPMTLGLAETASPGVSFVDPKPMWRPPTCSKPGTTNCVDTCAANTYPQEWPGEQGGHGPEYYCTPRAYWAETRSVDADLITRVDNLRGDVTTYEYGWSQFPDGVGRGPAVLSRRFRRIIGRTPFEAKYTYEQPIFTRDARFVGFGKITVAEHQHGLDDKGRELAPVRPGPTRTRTTMYRLQADLVVPERTEVKGSDGSIRAETHHYEVKMLWGVPLVRPTSIEHHLTVGATSVRLDTTTYGYKSEGDVCPSNETRIVSPSEKTTSKFEYAQPKNVESSLACLPKLVTRSASPDLVETAYDDNGLTTKVEARSAKLRVSLHSAKYDSNGNLRLIASADTGETKVTSFKKSTLSNKTVDLTLPETLLLPDGRRIDFDYDPVEDFMTLIKGSRPAATAGGSPVTRRFVRSRGAAKCKSSALGRIETESLWDEGFATSDGPSLEVISCEASETSLGARWTRRPENFALVRNATESLTVVDGAGQTMALLHALSKSNGKTRWAIDQATLPSDVTDEIEQFQGGELNIVDGEVPSVHQLRTASKKVRTWKQALSALAVDETEYVGSVSPARWTTKASLDANGAVTLSRVDLNDSNRPAESRRFDAVGRLVGTTTAGNMSVTTEYDATGNVRLLHLPGGSSAEAVYDGLGRLKRSTRDGIEDSYSYTPGRNLVQCMTSTVLATKQQVSECYEWDPAGRPKQRLSSVDKKPDDVVVWTYAPGYWFPKKISGRGFTKTFETEGIDGLHTKWSALTTEVFPTPEAFANPPVHDPKDSLLVFERSSYRVDGSVSETNLRVRNGNVVVEDRDCRETRDALGLASRWTCPGQGSGLSIAKTRLSNSTDYAMSTGRTFTVTHSDELRTWDRIAAKRGGATEWEVTRRLGIHGTYAEAFSYAGSTDNPFFMYDGNGALKQVSRYFGIGTKIREEANTFEYTADGLLAAVSIYGKPKSMVSRSAKRISVSGRDWTVDDFGRISASDLHTTWNSRSQIEQVSKGNRGVSYLYDENGARLLRRELTPGSESSTFTVGNMQLRRGNTIYQSKYSIPIRVDGHIFAVITEKGLQPADYDSMQTLVGKGGKMARVDSPYGTRSNHVTDVPEFAGGYYDDLLGTIRFGQRDYIPELGQFSSRDPLFARNLSLAAGDPISANLYSYANQNPVDYRDPSGLRPCPGASHSVTKMTDIGGGVSEESVTLVCDSPSANAVPPASAFGTESFKPEHATNLRVPRDPAGATAVSADRSHDTFNDAVTKLILLGVVGETKRRVEQRLLSYGLTRGVGFAGGFAGGVAALGVNLFLDAYEGQVNSTANDIFTVLSRSRAAQ